MQVVVANRKGNFATDSVMRLKEASPRLYVVGQLHGALNDLLLLDEMIARDVARFEAVGAAVLHAGGYIDKGNQVPELLDYLEHRTHVGSARVTYLLGAHEWLMSRAVCGDRRAALQWLLSGAEASLGRWGVPTRDWIKTLPTTIPQNHIDFLRSLPASAVIGQTRFVCSSFVTGSTQPFGLFGQSGAAEALFGDGPICAIGGDSDVMRSVAPHPWMVRDLWTVERVFCTVLDRRVC